MGIQEKIIDELVSVRALSKKKAEELVGKAKEKKVSVEDVILREKSIDWEFYLQTKAKVLGLSYVNLLTSELNKTALNIIPLEVAKNYQIICFDVDKKNINIGLLNPDDYKAKEAVEFLASKNDLEPIYHLISEESFNKAIKQYQSMSSEIGEALEVRAKEEELEVSKKRKLEEREEIEESIKSAPVAKIVAVIIRHAVDGGASDIHIEPAQKECRVRYRIDGILKTSLVLPLNVHQAIVARIKVLTNLKLDETRIPQDGRIRMEMDGKQIDFRVSILPLIGQEKVVIRVLDTAKGAPTLEQLGYEGRAARVIMETTKQSNGMFLITGPTGSGKSTTLFSVLNLMNVEGRNISTLEDPVEYFIDGVNQSQIRPEIGFTFASGLRAILRQDPNIIMVGEIRDTETAELAIHSALTGHLVLSTLHTNSSIGTIPRLLDMKVEPFLLASTLNTIVAQRLARKICNNCKEKEKVPAEVIESVKKELSGVPQSILNESLVGVDFDNLEFYHGRGCERCGGTGYSGRIAIVEVIDVNKKIKEVIMDKGHTIRIEDIKENQDFFTMKQDGFIKVLKGVTTIEDVMRVVRT